MRYKSGGCSRYTNKPCSRMAIMHLTGMPGGVSQSVRKGSLRSLHQARRGTLSNSVDNHDRNHERGIESSQQNHCVDDIPSSTGPLCRASLKRLASVGVLPLSQLRRAGMLANVPSEIGRIF